MPSKIQGQMFRTVKSVKNTRSKRIVQNGENQWSGMYYGAPIMCTYGQNCADCCGYGNSCCVRYVNGQPTPRCGC